MCMIPDHPDIRSCEATGYPTWNQPETVKCKRCGDEIDSDVYFDDEHEYLCECCLLSLHKKW